MAIAGNSQVSPISNSNQTPVINDNFDILQNDVNRMSGSYIALNGYFTNGILDQSHGGTGATSITADTLLPSQSGHAGQFLQTNGTSSSWQDGYMPVYYPSLLEIIGSATTERSGTDTDYVKVKELTLSGSGSLYISFDIKNDDVIPGPCDDTYATIYRNGVAVGTEQTAGACSGVYTTFGESISGWSNGDKIQLYVKANGSNWFARNFLVYGTTLQVNTD